MSNRHSVVRWLRARTVVPMLAAGIVSISTFGTHAAATTTYTVYNTPSSGTPGDIDNSEIVDVTPNGRYALAVGTQRADHGLFIATLSPGGTATISETDLTSALPTASDRALTQPVLSSIAVHPAGTYALVTVREGASSVADTASERNGVGVFVRIDQNTGAVSVVTNQTIDLGKHAEAIDIAPNGDFAVVANQGSATTARSVQIVDLDAAGTPGGSVVRSFTPATVGQPEHVAISPNSQRAFVSFQNTGDMGIVNIATPLSSSTMTEIDIPGSSGTLPDGVAVLPTNEHIITANEGSHDVRLYQVGGTAAAPTLTLVASSGAVLASMTPEMVAVGMVGGTLRAFVTLESVDAVAVFTLAPAAVDKLVHETNVSLNRSGQPNADAPEGIAVAESRGIIVTANQGSQNLSIIQATSLAAPKNIYLPLVVK